MPGLDINTILYLLARYGPCSNQILSMEVVHVSFSNNFVSLLYFAMEKTIFFISNGAFYGHRLLFILVAN